MVKPVYKKNTCNFKFSKPNTYVLFVAILLSLAQAHKTVAKQEKLQSGSGQFVFKDNLGNRDKPIIVWYYMPEKFEPNTPIVFVMHGMKRNGKHYRDAWLKYARKYDFLLLAPEFSKEFYPSSQSYNRGNIFSSKGEPIPPSKWTFTAIERIFSYVRRITDTQAEDYYIYGHSAGAQFVHRLVLFAPNSHIKMAIAANAGWYALPTRKYEFPYGLKNTKVTKSGLKKSFRHKLIVLLGEKDTDPNHKHLKKTKQAMAQGKHRLERGITFFKIAKNQAYKLKTSFNWDLQTVPDVAHSNKGMAKAAVKLMFEQ